MRALVVVLASERIEVALLGGAGLSDRLDRLPFERPMHALVRAVLLRRRRPNALVRDSQLHPVDVQEREAVDGGGRA